MNENVLTRTELELTLTLGSLTARHGRPGAFVELQSLSDATGGMILRVSSTDGLEWSSSHTSLVSMGSPLPRVALDYPGLTRLRNGVRAAADLCGWVRLRADEHTLQLLADEGLIEATESNGRKTYALTDAGRAATAEAGEQSAPWETKTPRDSGRLTALPKAGMELAQVIAQVGRTGSPEQIAKAVDELEATRRRLYAILAEG